MREGCGVGRRCEVHRESHVGRASTAPSLPPLLALCSMAPEVLLHGHVSKMSDM